MLSSLFWMGIMIKYTKETCYLFLCPDCHQEWTMYMNKPLKKVACPRCFKLHSIIKKGGVV